MIWIPLTIILAALISIGDGKITPAHWAFRCDTVTNQGVVWLGANLDGSVNGYILRDDECN